MSLSAAKMILSRSGKVFLREVKSAHNIRTMRHLFGGPSAINKSPNRFFTRSLWYLCNEQPVSQKVPGFPKMCGCCGLHTQGDKEISEFLEDEIKMETEQDKAKGKLPSVVGFEIVKTDGAEVVLQKKNNNETITIRLNINHSVEDSNMDFDEGKEPTESEMMSKPPFSVEINKGGDKTLAINCQFPAADLQMNEQQSQEDYEDLVEISEVALLNNSNGDWSDSQYVLSGSIMDGNLYDMLMNMMEERGVTADTVDQIVDFSTAYEHSQYVNLLKNLKEFALEK